MLFFRKLSVRRPNFRPTFESLENRDLLSLGLSVIGSSPSGTLTGPISSAAVTFNQAVDTTTLIPANVRGSVAVTAINAVPGSGNTQFTLTFPPQTRAGIYYIVIGPNLKAASGVGMDQDLDNDAGEQNKDDFYNIVFTLPSPAVTGTAVLMDMSGNDIGLCFTFNSAINPATFTTGTITQFTGPNGAIAVSGVTPVSGSNNYQFDVMFAPQSTHGSYSMTLGSSIRDFDGNGLVTKGYIAVFTI